MSAKPSLEQVWAWLDEVPDPEIPAVSVVDLGIVREVAWEGDTLAVTVTPTYSGCPATAVITLDIAAALAAKGVGPVRLASRLAPPWTTDWITAKGREALRAYGIAPPAEGEAPCGLGAAEPPAVACPRCGAMETRPLSRFGSTPCKAQWRCDACLEPFDYFKRH